MRRLLMLTLLLALAGCGTAPTAATPSVGFLQISPQNSALLIGVNRLSVAIMDRQNHPILDASATVEFAQPDGSQESEPLQAISRQYGGIPVYIGVVRFAATGQYRLVVRITQRDGSTDSGQAFVAVSSTSHELPLGLPMPALRQRVSRDVGGQLSQIDSGVPPDPFHTYTVAEDLAAHRPMALYFGEPGRCPSATCGPTIQILEQLASTYGKQLDIEHIEIHDPADSNASNPAYVQLGLTSEPWIYFVTAAGRVADRFEGPVTLEQLTQSAQGTLAGHVPAVDIAPAR